MIDVQERFRGEQARWDAVIAHDPNADGYFYYGVKTTGVYCRPSCAARRALRKNVEFFESQDAAKAAGYRSCKRCQPDQPALSKRHNAVVIKACRIIEEAEESVSLDKLAKSVSLSPAHFHRIFKKITGLTPKAYAVAHRNKKIRKELERSSNITHAIYDAGYNTSGRFYASSSKLLGMTPTKYQKGGDGETIRFAVGECSLGSILVAASEAGICAIALGDDPSRLTEDLQDRFPKANLSAGDGEFEGWVAKIVGFVDNPDRELDLPLDIRGTSFQQKVWKALCAIPVGSTASYSDIAREIGEPGAARAVAKACASNNHAVAIPCHRVVRQDGGISGYRWGVERKQKLLNSEAVL